MKTLKKKHDRYSFGAKKNMIVSNTTLCMELCFEPKPIDEDIMVENTANRTENISKFEQKKKKMAQ